MRIDLCLKGIELQNPFVALIFPDLGNQTIDTVGPGNNTLRQLAHFIMGTDRQIDLYDSLGAETGYCSIERPDISGEKEGQAQDAAYGAAVSRQKPRT